MAEKLPDDPLPPGVSLAQQSIAALFGLRSGGDAGSSASASSQKKKRTPAAKSSDSSKKQRTLPFASTTPIAAPKSGGSPILSDQDQPPRTDAAPARPVVVVEDTIIAVPSAPAVVPDFFLTAAQRKAKREIELQQEADAAKAETLKLFSSKPAHPFFSLSVPQLSDRDSTQQNSSSLPAQPQIAAVWHPIHVLQLDQEIDRKLEERNPHLQAVESEKSFEEKSELFVQRLLALYHQNQSSIPITTSTTKNSSLRTQEKTSITDEKEEAEAEDFSSVAVHIHEVYVRECAESNEVPSNRFSISKLKEFLSQQSKSWKQTTSSSSSSNNFSLWSSAASPSSAEFCIFGQYSNFQETLSRWLRSWTVTQNSNSFGARNSKSENNHQKNNVPQAKAILLHSPPGGGKSTLINTICSDLGIRLLSIPTSNSLLRNAQNLLQHYNEATQSLSLPALLELNHSNILNNSNNNSSKLTTSRRKKKSEEEENEKEQEENSIENNSDEKEEISDVDFQPRRKTSSKNNNNNSSKIRRRRKQRVVVSADDDEEDSSSFVNNNNNNNTDVEKTNTSSNNISNSNSNGEFLRVALLFEDIDLLFLDEQQNFYAALASLIYNSKIPIVLTTSSRFGNASPLEEKHMSIEEKLKCFLEKTSSLREMPIFCVSLSRPSLAEMMLILRSNLFSAGILDRVSSEDLRSALIYANYDLRKTLSNFQFFKHISPLQISANSTLISFLENNLTFPFSLCSSHAEQFRETFRQNSDSSSSFSSNLNFEWLKNSNSNRLSDLHLLSAHYENLTLADQLTNALHNQSLLAESFCELTPSLQNFANSKHYASSNPVANATFLSENSIISAAYDDDPIYTARYGDIRRRKENLLQLSDVTLVYDADVTNRVSFHQTFNTKEMISNLQAHSFSYLRSKLSSSTSSSSCSSCSFSEKHSTSELQKLASESVSLHRVFDPEISVFASKAFLSSQRLLSIFGGAVTAARRRVSQNETSLADLLWILRDISRSEQQRRSTYSGRRFTHYLALNATLNLQQLSVLSLACDRSVLSSVKRKTNEDDKKEEEEEENVRVLEHDVK